MKKKLLMEFINLYEITRWMKKKKEEAKKNQPNELQTNETIKCNETNESDEYSQSVSPSYDSRKVTSYHSKNNPQAMTSKDENENKDVSLLELSKKVDKLQNDVNKILSLLESSVKIIVIK